MKKNNRFLQAAVIAMASFTFCACSSEEDKLMDNGDGQEETTPPVEVPTVTELKAEQTHRANELKISWRTPANIPVVILSYYAEDEDESEAQSVSVRTLGQNNLSYLLALPRYAAYHISAIATDNYGNRSKPVSLTATPAKEDVIFTWADAADSCTYVLIDQFMDKSKGTFWSTPKDVSGSSWNIYWQQAHAIDVLIYAYERIKDDNPTLAATYENYFRLWYQNHGNNYEHKADDETGFYNNFTDDMCWICLTLMHMSEATGDETYFNTARTVYDKYIIPRAWTDDKGTGLPWKADDEGRNTCTNSPGCLIAAKLYRKYNVESYKENALMLYNFMMKNNVKEDWRAEEPPLTYTQGTFGEACRQLYYITGETRYMREAENFINYAATSDRCLRDGLLRDEGTSMDQSIFKAVYIPYAVNLIQDENALYNIRVSLKSFLEKNGTALRNNLQHYKYPAMYCNYFWGQPFTGNIASMGAQVSGASLLEGVARLTRQESNPAQP